MTASALNSLKRCGWRACPRAFTLVEMLISLGIVTLISLACMSVTRLMVRSAAANADNAAPGLSAAAREALDQMARDLKMATVITERTATAITVTVPDRDGDGNGEVIRYSWAGKGSPLTRQYKGLPAVNLVAAVNNLSLSYIDRSVLLTATAAVESPEQVLASRDWPTLVDLQGLAMKNNSAAEFFRPTLPANPVSWKITRLKLKVARNLVSTGTLVVSVRFVDAFGMPTGNALATYNLDIATVPVLATWMDIPLTAIAGIDPAASLAIQVLTTASSTIGNLSYDKMATSTSSAWMTGNAAGASWTSPDSGKSMEFYVYGTVTAKP